MKYKIIIGLFLIGIFFGLANCGPKKEPKKVFDTRLTFSTKTYNPYDIKFFYEELKKHAKKGFVINKDPLDSINKNIKSKNSVYVVTSPYFLPNDTEKEQLFSFAEEGNTVFISAFSVSQNFLNSLIHSNINVFYTDNFPPVVRPDPMSFTWNDTTLFPKKNFSYPGYHPIVSFFDSLSINGSGFIPPPYADEISNTTIDSTATVIDEAPRDSGAVYADEVPKVEEVVEIDTSNLYSEEEDYYEEEFVNRNLQIHVVDNEGKPQLISLERGKGRIFIHANPICFSNYFTLHKQNHVFLNEVFQLIGINDKRIIWDDFYKNYAYERPEPSQFKEESFFWKLVHDHPPLTWAFYTFLAAIALFILVYFRRIQQPMPVLPVIKNNSLEFVSAISSLYWLEQDHKTVSEKLKHQFLDYLSSNFRIFPKDFSDENKQKIIQKTGRDPALISELISQFETIEKNEKVSKDFLLNLYKKIYKFYHS